VIALPKVVAVLVLKLLNLRINTKIAKKKYIAICVSQMLLRIRTDEFQIQPQVQSFENKVVVMEKCLLFRILS